MSYSEQTEIIAPPLGERAGNSGSSVWREPSPSQRWFNNVPPDLASANERKGVIAGQGDLRISLTSACNLRCSYCHNEGQEAPWLQVKTAAMLGNIERLLEIAT